MIRVRSYSWRAREADSAIDLLVLGGDFGYFTSLDLLDSLSNQVITTQERLARSVALRAGED